MDQTPNPEHGIKPGGCSPSQGSVSPDGWLVDLAAHPWNHMDSDAAATAALSFLMRRGFRALLMLPDADCSLWRIWGLDRALSLPWSDPLFALLRRHTADQTGPLAVGANGLHLIGADPAVAGWIGSRPLVVAPVVAADQLGFLLVDPGSAEPGQLAAGIQILALHVGLAISRAVQRDHVQRLNAQVEEANSHLIELAETALTDQTVNAVAHQINNCLTSVMGYSQLLLEIGLRSPEEDGYMRRIFAEAERMSRPIENMLNFLRRRNYEPDLVDVNELLQQAVALQAYDLEKHNITVRLDLDPDLPLTFGDAYKLQVVFINLIMNAHQALAETGAPGEIAIATRQSSERVGRIVVEVNDTGPGISKDDLENVFDPFFTTRRHQKHVGLGLTVVRRRVEEHDGLVFATFRTGGASFTIELPVRTAEGQVADTQRILIVDNEEDVVALLARVFESGSYQIDTASSAEEALQRLAQSDYDCILADLRMPGMGGQAFYQTVTGSRPELAARFVIITADNGRPEVSSFLSESGVRWIAKPFDLLEVMRAVEQVLPASTCFPRGM